MDGRHGAAQFHTDPDDVGRPEHRAVLQQLFERAAADELHPEADAIADLFGAVNRDDVGMSDSGEQPAFLDERALAGAGRSPGWNELQGDFTIQARVPGAEHFAERAATDAFDQSKMAPLSRRGPHKLTN